MAIDSNEKKASLINFGTPFYIVGPLVATWSQDEYQHILHLYSGILATEPAGAVLFYDDGEDDDDTSLDVHVPNIDQASAGYVEDNGAWIILSNTIQASGADPGGLNWLCSTDQDIADQFRVEVDCICQAGTSSRAGIAFRMSDANNFWLVWLREGTDDVRLYKVVAGSISGLLASGAVTLSPGNTYALKVEVNGTVIDVWVDGDLKIDSFDTEDSFNQSAEKIGLNNQLATAWDYDEFKITDLTAEEVGAVLLLRLLTEGIFLGERP